MKKLPIESIDNMGMMKDMLSKPTELSTETPETEGADIATGSRVTLDSSVVDMNSITPGAEIGMLIKGTVAGKSDTGVEVDISSVEVSGAKKEEPKGERPSLSIMLGGGLTK